MQIQVIKTGKTEHVPNSKNGYDVFELTYRRDGKVEGKKLVSFNYPEVFAALKDSQEDEWYEITTVKNERGYWDWTKAKQVDSEEAAARTVAKIPPSKYVPKVASAGPKQQWVPDEVRQKLIVRQSSLGSAVELLSHFGDAKNQKEAIDAALKLAEVFVGWVFEDIEDTTKVSSPSEIQPPVIIYKEGEPPVKRHRRTKAEMQAAEVEVE